MGNPNNQQQKRKKKYTGKNVNPLSGTIQMGQHGIRAIRNLAFGNFNMEKDGVYFQNHDYVMAVIHEVENKIKEENIYNTALNFTYGMTNDITVIKMMNDHKRALDAWTMVLNTLGAIMNTGDITLLVGLANRLPDYRYLM